MLGSAKGMWQKCTARRSGRAVGQHLAEEGEVVVLHQDGRAGRGPLDHGVGHHLVVPAVALPRQPPVPVEPGPAGQVEEMVVQVPQGGVGHDVVGRPVGLVIDDDGEQREAVVDHATLLDRGAVGGPHGHRDPGRPGAGQQRRDRGDEPATAGHGDQGTVSVEAEGERSAIGDDDAVVRRHRLSGRPGRGRPARRRWPGGGARRGAGCDGCARPGRPGPGRPGPGGGPRR